MQQEIKENPVLSAVDIIFTKGQKSKFTESFQQSVSKEAQVICEYLGIDSEAQALCWAMLFGMGIQANSALDIDNFSNYLNVSVLRAFQFTKDLDSLARRKLLAKQKNTRRRRGGESLNYLNLYVPSDLVYAVVNGEPLPSRRKTDMNLYELLDNVYMYFQQRDDGYIDTEELGIEITGLLEENKKLPFVRQVLNYKLPLLEQIILMVVCQQFVEGYSSIDFVRLLKTLFVETQKQLNCRKAWINNQTKLQKVGLVDLENESSFRNDKAIVLTSKGQELFGTDRSLFIEQDVPKNKNIILSSSIVEKRLFFNEKEQKSLDNLTDLLRVDNHLAMVNRLKDLGYNTGMTILFHGKNFGTGKTQSVLNIARLTGRDIFWVNIAECKNKYWGETERRVAGLFDYYRKMVNSYEVSPILCFNEMDAVFTTRVEGGNSNTQTTQNATVDILLNELETFPLRGILLSTTNLPNNIDKAFDRRFLYKIHFDKPNSHTRSLIWKDKLSLLSDKQADYLSEKFPFSGGQIENVVKKTQIEVLFGRTSDLNLIESFCLEETLNCPFEKKRIGYLG
jgi:hypothetical protein